MNRRIFKTISATFQISEWIKAYRARFLCLWFHCELYVIKIWSAFLQFRKHAWNSLWAINVLQHFVLISYWNIVQGFTCNWFKILNIMLIFQIIVSMMFLVFALHSMLSFSHLVYCWINLTIYIFSCFVKMIFEFAYESCIKVFHRKVFHILFH